MTATEAARLLLLNRDYVNRLAQLGHIKAEKRGRMGEKKSGIADRSVRRGPAT